MVSCPRGQGGNLGLRGLGFKGSGFYEGFFGRVGGRDAGNAEDFFPALGLWEPCKNRAVLREEVEGGGGVGGKTRVWVNCAHF